MIVRQYLFLVLLLGTAMVSRASVVSRPSDDVETLVALMGEGAQAQDSVSRIMKYPYVMELNSSGLAVVDSNVVVSLQITAIQDIPMMQSVILAPELTDTLSMRTAEFPLIFINSRNQQIYFERDLKSEYPDALALRKKKGKNLKIDYVRTIKYEPWMKDAVLKVKQLSCACNRRKERDEEIVATFARDNVPIQIDLYPVYVPPPADNSVKVREEKGSAYLCFVVNKWDIKPDYMDNPVELQKIHNSVNLVKNDSNVSIRKMVIEGYASPEGNYNHNKMLSENRTNSLKQYLQRAGKLTGFPLEASGKGENWEGFLKALREERHIPQRDKLLAVVHNNSLSSDEKEREMKRQAPEGYAYVLNNIFPALRCTNYTVIFTVRPFTIEESEAVFETKPIYLNLNEIYRLAEKYADDQEKYYSIIRKAYTLYPNDSYINLTMAYLSIRRRDGDAAAEYLSKVEASPQKTMNEGLVAYLQGDLNKAIQLVEQARAQGVAEATRQLEEFKKLK